MNRKRKKKLATPIKKRTRSDISYPRQDDAIVTLFRAGFDLWEISALLLRSEGIVTMVLRQRAK